MLYFSQEKYRFTKNQAYLEDPDTKVTLVQNTFSLTHPHFDPWKCVEKVNECQDKMLNE